VKRAGSQPRRTPWAEPSFLLVAAAFGLFGLLFGVWQAVIADLQRALELSPSALGAAITAGVVTSFPVMLAGGRIADRLGARAIIASSALLMALSFGGLAFVHHYWALVGLLVMLFSAAGAFDVGVNAAAISIEQQVARPLLPMFHAAFSGAGALGAFASGGLLFVGVPFRALYLIVACVMAALAVILWRSTALTHHRLDPPSTSEPRGDRAALYRMPALLLLAAITALGFLSEGTLETWSAIYLCSALNMPAAVGAAGPAVFHTAMLLGRLSFARAVTYVGRRRLLLWAGGAAGVGMLIALSTMFAPLILLGILVAGLALSGIAPITFSVAGDLAPHRTGEVSSIITAVGYGGFLLGPAIIGGLAELASLRVALLTVVVAGGLIVTLSLWVKDDPRRHTTA
jgi:MFS family permease